MAARLRTTSPSPGTRRSPFIVLSASFATILLVLFSDQLQLARPGQSIAPVSTIATAGVARSSPPIANTAADAIPSSSPSNAVSPRSSTAPQVVSLPSASPHAFPLHLAILCAPGLKWKQLGRTLRSFAQSAPATVIALVIDEQADVQTMQYIKYRVDIPRARGEINASEAASMPSDVLAAVLWPKSSKETAEIIARDSRIPIWIRVYSWQALSSTLPALEQSYHAPIRRYSIASLILDDFEGLLHGSISSNEGAFDAGERLPAEASGGSPVMWSNLPAALMRAPDAVLLCDARDIAIQRDPFTHLWVDFIAPEQHGDHACPQFNAKIHGIDVISRAAAHPLRGWRPAFSALPYVIVAGEAPFMTIGEENWNRGWVHQCYGYTGEAIIYDRHILCSGTTMGTLPGIRHYLDRGMKPALRLCDRVHWPFDAARVGEEKGLDQGVHNIIMHGQSEEALLMWRKQLAKGTYFSVVELHHRPVDKSVGEPLLDLIESFQAPSTCVQIRVANAADGLFCTLGVLIATQDRTKLPTRHPEHGWVARDDMPEHACAVVHQFDRRRDLEDHFDAVFGVPD